MLIERAQSWHYPHGTATVQLVRGETDSPVTLWEGRPVRWAIIPRDGFFPGVAERVYARMVADAERCWQSWQKREA